MAGTFFRNYYFEYPNDNMIISTSSIQEVPSNKTDLINLTINGVLKPSSHTYIFQILFTNNDFPRKDRLASAYGTFTIGNKVYNATKIIKPAYDKTTKILTIILDMSATTCYQHVKKLERFSFNVQMNDCSNACGSGCYGCGVCLSAAACVQ